MPPRQANAHPGPGPIDQYVAARLRIARITAGMTLEELGGFLGVTHQQARQYERGTHRIAASRLFLAARALGLPVDYFFDGLIGSPLDRFTAASPIRHEATSC